MRTQTPLPAWSFWRRSQKLKLNRQPARFSFLRQRVVFAYFFCCNNNSSGPLSVYAETSYFASRNNKPCSPMIIAFYSWASQPWTSREQKAWIMNVKWVECKANNAARRVMKISFFLVFRPVDLVLSCLELARESKGKTNREIKFQSTAVL